MNPAKPKLEGSIGLGHLDVNLTAACLPGETPTTDWAYGMPLSYVHEMAGRWLSLFDQAAMIPAPVDLPSISGDTPDAGSE